MTFNTIKEHRLAMMSGERYNDTQTLIDKEAIRRYNNEWYARNAERVRAKAKKKVICECGMEISKGNLGGHRKSIKHNQIMKNRPLTPRDD